MHSFESEVWYFLGKGLIEVVEYPLALTSINQAWAGTPKTYQFDICTFIYIFKQSYFYVSFSLKLVSL